MQTSLNSWKATDMTAYADVLICNNAVVPTVHSDLTLDVRSMFRLWYRTARWERVTEYNRTVGRTVVSNI